MNRYNLRRLEYFGASVPDRPGQNHLVINLAGGRQIGFGSPPHPHESDKFLDEAAGVFVESDAGVLCAVRCLHGLAKLAQASNSATKDQRLTPIGRQEKVAAVAAEVVQAISGSAAALRKRQAEVQALEYELFETPLLLQSDDHVAIAHDREIRDRYLRADGQIDGKLIGQLVGGKADRLAAALLRSPMPLATDATNRARDAWRAAITAREPEKAAAWQAASANAEWSEQVVVNTARISVEISALPRVQVYKAALAGDLAVFNITATEQQMFAHQLATAA